MTRRTTDRLLPGDNLGSARLHFEHASKHMQLAAEAIFRADYEFALLNIEDAHADLIFTVRALRILIEEEGG